MTHTTETMSNAEKIAAGLTEAQRGRLREIALPAGDYFRLDEGEAHGHYTALRRRGLLGADRFGDMGTHYYVTPKGAAVREILRRQS